MKKLIVVFIVLAQIVSAQESSEKRKLLSGFYYDFSKQIVQYYNNDMEPYYDRVKSIIAFPDKIDEDHTLYLDNNGTTTFKLGVCLDVYKKMEIRTGISYINGNRKSALINTERSLGSDTIYSGTDMLIHDSTLTSHYIIDEGIDELALDAAILYRSDPTKRVNFYLGVGGNIGYAVATELKSYKTESISGKYTINNKEYFLGEVYHNKTSEYNTYDYDNSVFLRAYVPVGFNVQLTEGKGFFDHLWLNMYASLGIENQLIDGSSSLHEYYSLGAAFIYYY